MRMSFGAWLCPARWAVLAALGCAAGARAGSHPCLLIRADELPRLRHRCGVGAPAEGSGWGRYAAAAEDYGALRRMIEAHPGKDLLPGELTAAAFVHLIAPETPAGRAGLRIVRDALLAPLPVTADPLEYVVALDWCFDALPSDVRREGLTTLRTGREALTPADSPLEPREFARRLTGLALAIAIDAEDEPSAAWHALRDKLLAAGRTYVRDTLPRFVEWRGAAPTGPDAAAAEEWQTVLAAELASLCGTPPAPSTLPRNTDGEGERAESPPGDELMPRLARWMEHYVCVAIDDPGFQHQFVRDDAADAPLTPAAHWRNFRPVTAHLLAARAAAAGASAAAAASVADRVAEAMRTADSPLAASWRWVPIVFDLTDAPRIDRERLPTTRNLGGAIVLRAGRGPLATVIWIEACQPFLRRGQHFDAGHFLIHHRGRLVGGAGDEIALEATPSRGGLQRLGESRDPFDFDQFHVATISHNALIAWDAARAESWYRRTFRAVGGQRPIEGDCGDFSTPLDAQKRATGALRAYGSRDGAAYVALDLTAAYDERVVTRCTREFVFVLDRALLVIDRVRMPQTRTAPTVVVQAPKRPTIDGADLPESARVAGASQAAGIWHADEASWLRWTQRDGALWLAPVAPTARRVRVVGGPGERLTVPDGQHKGRPYYGGAAEGFERLIVPAERHGAQNAWYRLGAPALLGDQVGRAEHWGRVEIEPARPADEVVFATLLVVDAADRQTAPSVTSESGPDGWVMALEVEGSMARIRPAQGLSLGGTVECSGWGPATWELPSTVTADAELATAPAPK